MTPEEIQKFESGFNEGFLYAAQVVASAIIRNLHNSPAIMLPKDRERFIAQIKLSTEKRKLVPTSYQVMRGNAEDVTVNIEQLNEYMKTVVIHGVKYQAVDFPTYKVDFTCGDCDIYKAKIPQHLGDVPMCCEDKFEHINKSHLSGWLLLF